MFENLSTQFCCSMFSSKPPHLYSGLYKAVYHLPLECADKCTQIAVLFVPQSLDQENCNYIERRASQL